MTDREKLVELIKSAKAAMRGKEFSCNLEREYFMAEYLIAHGVTVRPMQKPLTLEELHDVKADAFLEVDGCDYIFHVTLLESDDLVMTEFREVGCGDMRTKFFCENRLYGKAKAWRCWAEKPTDEERKAAEWL